MTARAKLCGLHTWKYYSRHQHPQEIPALRLK